MAHVKSGGGKQKNGRDSNPQYLGVKRYGGEFVTAGSIIVRQRGSKFHPGEFAGKGRDDTIYAKIDGHVKFHTRRNRKFISIEPASV